jgi:hypothetical protein
MGVVIAFRPATPPAGLADDGPWVAASAPWAVVLEERAMILDPARRALGDALAHSLTRGLTGPVSLLPDHRAAGEVRDDRISRQGAPG